MKEIKVDEDLYNRLVRIRAHVYEMVSGDLVTRFINTDSQGLDGDKVVCVPFGPYKDLAKCVGVKLSDDDENVKKTPRKTK